MLLNLPRALAWLDQCGLDAVVATSWPNVLYLSDYYLWLLPVFKEYMANPGGSSDPMPLFAILTSQGSAALVLDKMCELSAEASWVPDRYVYGVSPTSLSENPISHGPFVRSPHRFETAVEALVGALHDQQLSDARIGLELESLPPSQLAGLKAALPRAEIRDASNLFRLIRMVKSSEELSRLRRAAEINEQAAADCLALATPGSQMQHVVREFRRSVATAGAAFDHFAFSQQGVGFATDNEYPLPSREAMFVDFGCIFQNYYSDAGITLIIGTPTDRVRTGYPILADCLSQTALQLRPGAKASSIQSFMQRHFEQRGLKGQLPHGHGIGIELRDYPILTPDEGRRIRDDCVEVSADLPLEVGMVINLEAPVFELGDSALQLEQTFVVTADGGIPLTDRDLSRPTAVGG